MKYLILAALVLLLVVLLVHGYGYFTSAEFLGIRPEDMPR